jgi:hypothetical protein
MDGKTWKVLTLANNEYHRVATQLVHQFELFALQTLVNNDYHRVTWTVNQE